MPKSNSYGQIMRSSALIGGAQAINYLIGLLRNKAVAVLLGPAGLGMVGLYSAAMNTIGSVTGLGLQRSAVRAIALAKAQDDPLAVARAIRMLRRLCWATGALGWLASAALAIPLSRMMFQSTAYAWAVALLGFTLLINAINGGQMALLRGLRRIGDIARVQVASAMVNTVVIIALYAWLRERGIVPVLMSSAVMSLAMSWWFIRRVQVEQVDMSWAQAIAEAKPMVSLGAAMMTSAVVANLLELYTRSLLGKAYGLDAVGIYQAAWTLSGMFAGFVLSAMGTDFYPRLTAVIHDRVAAIREINQQTEIGLLLTLPGLLATVALAKWVLVALYTNKFTPAADVLVWMILGVFGRVLSWPLGYVQLALNAGKWYVTTELLFIGIQAGLMMWAVPRVGVIGAAYAFFGCYFLYFFSMSWVAHRLIGFRHSHTARHLIIRSVSLVVLAMAANRLLPEWPSALVGVCIAAIGGLWCLRGLIDRLGTRQRVIQLLLRIPGLARILGVRNAA